MRKRIQQLASGKFDDNGPCLSLSAEKIELELLEGKDETGDFVITSTNHVKMRGLVYSSNPRMECLTPQFEGEEARIRYQFHTEGLIEGDIQKGEFFIVCNQGEYNLSFVVSISRLYADFTQGKIKTLSDFTRLAKENYDEAVHLFYSNNFTNLLRENREKLFYKSIRTKPQTIQNVEEFLIACDRKKRVELSLAETEGYIYEVTESKKEAVELHRQNWGAVEVQVTSDADFLIPGKMKLTSNDFLGSVCPFEYYINHERMHAGKNFGKLKFEWAYGTFYYSVMATSQKKEEKKEAGFLELQTGRAELMRLYIDYRLKKIVTGAWAGQSVKILEHLSTIEPDNAMWNLMKAQALLINRQKQEASWILSDYKRSCTDRTTPVWGYYLYLCTLMEREESYVDRLTEEIEQIFYRYPDNSMLFWILLFVKEEYYRNNKRRQRELERWIANGNNSPYLYLEAYYLFWQDPYLLTKLGPYEIKVLTFARKQDAITKDMAMQVRNLLAKQKEYDRKLYPILEKCYEIDESPEMTAAICAYLIRSQKFEKKYHIWYERGIKSEIRITNLYEAFLLSMDETKSTEIPKVLQMYFQYNSSLSYKHLAALYVNIIAMKEEHPDTYERYKRTIEQFAVTQLEASRMDENLAVIYKEMLPVSILNEELAKKAADVLFVHKLSCNIPNIATAYIRQKELTDCQIVPIVNGSAYFKAYTEEYVIMLVDMQGRCYLGGYLDEPLLCPENYIDRCMELAPEELPYLLYLINHRKEDCFLQMKDKQFQIILSSEKVQKSYKMELLPEILRFYQKNKETDFVLSYLQKTDISDVRAEDRAYFEQMFIEYQLFEKAYQMVQMFGYEQLGNSEKVSLCSYEITQGSFEEDDYLLGLAQTCFCAGKYNDVILIYLSKVFNGSTKLMAEIWQAAGNFEIDTFDLEERIITQMLYSTDYVNNIEKIYESYCAGGGREVVCMAYLSYFSHCYLTKDMVVPNHIFSQIEERYFNHENLNDACKIGLLKQLAEKEKTDAKEKNLIDGLLMEYTTRNIYFSFYKKFDEKLIQKYHLYDKFFVEYHTAPGRHVLLNYSVNGESFKKEELSEVYDGIYVKAFVLLFGEEVSYYISESVNGEWKAVESRQLSNRDIYGDKNQSRYDGMNGILFALATQDEMLLKKSMKQYEKMKYVSEEIFELL